MSFGYAFVLLPLVAVVIAMSTARRHGSPGLSRRVAVMAIACFCVGGVAGFVLTSR